MKPDPISLQRRHLIMAGLAGVAAPAAVFAAPLGGDRRSAAEEGLVVSGRVLGSDYKPLADACVEAWHAGDARMRASATTDADGRFMFTTTARTERDGRPQSISYRVSRHGRAVAETRLDFARPADAGRGPGAQLQRDDAGVWRAAVGITIA